MCLSSYKKRHFTKVSSNYPRKFFSSVATLPPPAATSWPNWCQRILHPVRPYANASCLGGSCLCLWLKHPRKNYPTELDSFMSLYPRLPTRFTAILKTMRNLWVNTPSIREQNCFSLCLPKSRRVDWYDFVDYSEHDFDALNTNLQRRFTTNERRYG